MPAFQADAFQNDAFQTGADFVNLGLINQTAITYSLTLIYAQSIDDLALIDRTAVVHAPTVSGTMARLYQEPVEAVVLPTSGLERLYQQVVDVIVAPTPVGGIERLYQQVVEVVVERYKVVALARINQTAVAFAPVVSLIDLGIIDQTAVIFALTLSYTQDITLGLITQAATASTPVITNVPGGNSQVIFFT